MSQKIYYLFFIVLFLINGCSYGKENSYSSNTINQFIKNEITELIYQKYDKGQGKWQNSSASDIIGVYFVGEGELSHDQKTQGIDNLYCVTLLVSDFDYPDYVVSYFAFSKNYAIYITKASGYDWAEQSCPEFMFEVVP